MEYDRSDLDSKMALAEGAVTIISFEGAFNFARIPLQMHVFHSLFAQVKALTNIEPRPMVLYAAADKDIICVWRANQSDI